MPRWACGRCGGGARGVADFGVVAAGAREALRVKRCRSRGCGNLPAMGVARNGVVAIFRPRALREMGLWQSGGRERCAKWGCGNLPPASVARNGVVAIGEKNDLRFFSPLLRKEGLWQWHFCHKSNSRNAQMRQIATTPFFATAPSPAASLFATAPSPVASLFATAPSFAASHRKKARRTPARACRGTTLRERTSRWRARTSSRACRLPRRAMRPPSTRHN